MADQLSRDVIEIRNLNIDHVVPHVRDLKTISGKTRINYDVPDEEFHNIKECREVYFNSNFNSCDVLIRKSTNWD